jgi:hypothetical protein
MASTKMFASKSKLGMIAGVFAVSFGPSMLMASPARLDFPETVDQDAADALHKAEAVRRERASAYETAAGELRTREDESLQASQAIPHGSR